MNKILLFKQANVMHSIILIVLISLRYIHASECERQGNILTCTNLNLRNTNVIPANNVQNIVEIKFKTSVIPIISSGMFARFSGVTKLTIDTGGVQTIEPAAFSGMDHLLELNIYRNMISDFQPGTINSIHSLEKIYLLHNKLTKIKKHYFDNLIKLTHLDLDSNLLEELSDDAFENLNNLVTLDLRSNRLKYISPDCFKNLKKLQTLFLQNNLLTKFEFDLFRNLHSMVHLDLGLNTLTVLNECSLMSLRNLETFSVYNNTLTHINTNLFLTALPKLKKVYMNNNLWYCSSLTNTLVAFIRRGIVLESNSTTTRNVLGISCVNGSVPDSIDKDLTMEDCLILKNKTNNNSTNFILNNTTISNNISANLFGNEIFNNINNGTGLFGILGGNESVPGSITIDKPAAYVKGFSLNNNTDNNSNNDFIEIVYNTMFRFRTNKTIKEFQRLV